MKKVTRVTYTDIPYNLDIVQDIATCMWCNDRLRHTVNCGRMEIVTCEKETCRAMRELMK